MRVIFAGSPEIAVPSLIALSEMENIELVGVLTNPDTPKGRSGAPTPTEVGVAAGRLGKSVAILKPQKLDTAAREQIAALKPDLLVSFAYGRIFGQKFLALFPLGGINIHPSLLPKYRGPTPIQAAILNGDSVTGISIQRLALEIDSGDILDTEEIQLTGKETAASLSEVIAKKSALLLPSAIKKISSGERGVPQDHGKASYCALIQSEDGLVDWNQSARKIEAKIRAFTPWPLCRTRTISSTHNERKLFILKSSIYKNNDIQTPNSKPQTPCSGRVLGIDKQNGILIQTGEGILAVTELQYQQKKALFWKDFLNGARDFIGSILS